MKTLYSYTFPSVSTNLVALGKTPWAKIGLTTREDPMARIREQIGTSNPEEPDIIGTWEVNFDDKEFHYFLKNSGVRQLSGPGKEWFEIHPQQLKDMVKNFSEIYSLSRPGGKCLPRKRTVEIHNNTISDSNFVSFCLRRILWDRIFPDMRSLEEAILREDEFGVFLNGISSVKCALQPFVKAGYERSNVQFQDKHGVCVYRVGDSGRVAIEVVR
jgi:hypothetical protein